MCSGCLQRVGGLLECVSELISPAVALRSDRSRADAHRSMSIYGRCQREIVVVIVGV